MMELRVWVVFVLSIPVILYSSTVQRLIHIYPPVFPYSGYMPVILSTIIYLYGGIVFLRGARQEFIKRTPGMMTLVSLAITVAYAYSLVVSFGLVHGQELYWELVTLVTVMLLGHMMEMSAIEKAGGALDELAKLMPDTAERMMSGGTEIIPITELRVGDRTIVRPGSRIPADGEVVWGDSTVNESMLTGESRPVEKQPGLSVIAGTMNGEGVLRVKVTKTGGDTALAGIMALVDQAQKSRTRAQNLADRMAYALTILAIAVSGFTFLFWWLAEHSPVYAMDRAVTVLVIACPHALGLAIPLVVAISTTIGAKRGLLVRDRLALETARNVNTVVFDKTGTLTEGAQGIVDIHAVDGVHKAQALAMAASIERYSEHVLAKAIVGAAMNRGLWLSDVSDFKALPGMGAEGVMDGHHIVVGGPRLLETMELYAPESFRHYAKQSRTRGHALVYLVCDGRVTALIALADVIRRESHEAVKSLKQMGIRVVMMTGDSEGVAKWVSDELEIDEFHANVLPGEKERRVKQMRASGRNVAMVGDGVNDAPALVSANVGIAIGAGTDIAIEAGGIILVRNDPRDVVSVIKLSRATYTKMVENLIWAMGYNVVAIPLAAGMLYSYHIVPPPALGALLMFASTAMVSLNAIFLRVADLNSD
jgi:Cu2+-exporting ATPase